MPKLNIAPTKSNLLALRRQLAFAEEGYDLLEEKRQILILELMGRLKAADDAERGLTLAVARAHAALREAGLDVGTAALDRIALGLPLDHRVTVASHRLMGLAIPTVTSQAAPGDIGFGIGGTSASLDLARRAFLDLLPLLARFAELDTAVRRLARELRKTQRRCNALSKIFIPSYRETHAFIQSTLEERDRESLIILRLIRDRLAAARQD